MRQCEIRNLRLAGDAREELMPQLASRHFNRELFVTCERANVCAAHVNTNPAVSCELADEPLIRIAAPAAKPVVEMRNFKSPEVGFRKSMEALEQDHRIRAAGYPDQHSISL